ncbi:MAG TPA: hypothetical protein VFX38_03225 [Gammaproteobacteria bacterium]|nr:hypothetical protein [Gammaproteobacteria bacterium]
MSAEESGAPAVAGARGLALLASTRRWAIVVGLVFAIFAALMIASYLARFFGDRPANLSPEIWKFSRIALLVLAVLVLLLQGALSCFALQYGRRIGHSLARMDPVLLETALWWQRRFWTLQGALIMAVLILWGLAFVVGIFAVFLHLA